MSIVSRRMLGVLTLVLAAQSAFAQTADEVVERTLKASGGREALSKITSRVASGTITVSTPGGDITGPIEMTNQAPNKVRTLIQLDLSVFNLGKMSVDQRFDGTTGYVVDTLQGNRDITGDQLEIMRSTLFPHPFLNYREAGIGIELIGTEKVGDRDAFVLLVKPKTGPSSRHYIDTTSNLPIRQVFTATLDQVGEVEQTIDIVGYRDVEGIQVPTRVRTASSVQTATITMTNVQHNVPVDAAIFAKP